MMFAVVSETSTISDEEGSAAPREAEGSSHGAPTRRGNHCAAVMTNAQDRHAQGSETALAPGTTTPMSYTPTAYCDAFAQARGGRQAWAALGWECYPLFRATNLHRSWRQRQARARRLRRG